MSFGNDLSTSANGTNPWFTISIGLVCVMFGYGLATVTLPTGGGTAAPSQQAAANTTSSVAAAPTPAPTGKAPTPGVGPTLGKDSAKVTLVEFTDYQCPFCSRHFNQTVGQLKTNYVDTGKIKYETRNLPLSFHKFAQVSAEAAMCANKQGKFWEMHDQLFIKQSEWTKEVDPKVKFKEYAAAIGINGDTLVNCIDKGETKAEVAKDATDAASAGVTGTPGFWLIGPNGKVQQMKGAQAYTAFSAAIDAMLQ